jgi:hypothetical protein
MKTFILTTVATLALLCLMAPNAKADHIEDHSFLEKTSNFTDASKQTVFDRSNQIDQLTVEMLEKFQSIASEQTQIWSDTILEGDYQADDQTVLDQVEELKSNGELVAYHVTYSQRGWDTSLCTYPGNLDLSALAQCQEGRIVESSFVSRDLKSWSRDPARFASFESK